MTGPPTAAQLVGTWQLIRWTATLDDEPPVHPMSPEAEGLLVYAADGWMSAVLTLPRRASTHTTSLAAADVEARAEAARGYVSYAGRWRLEGATVHHEVAHSLHPDWVGTTVSRRATLADDGTLSLRTLPQTTRSGRVVVNTLTWRRADG